jgi:glycerol-3-phosphate O-acyltransferase/dihydroxyacetone phosphate acyltransferase
LIAAASAVPPAEGDSAAASMAYRPIRDLTDQIEAAIRSGCLDAPSWRIMAVAHIARRLYAPGGPGVMSLADYVSITQVRPLVFRSHQRTCGLAQAFCDIFAKASGGHQQPVVEDPLIEAPPKNVGSMPDNDYIKDLASRLAVRAVGRPTPLPYRACAQAYQAQLRRVGLKDARIDAHSELGLLNLAYRLSLRILLATILTILSFPGLLLWLPVLAITKERELKFRRKGPAWDGARRLTVRGLPHLTSRSLR